MSLNRWEKTVGQTKALDVSYNRVLEEQKKRAVLKLIQNTAMQIKYTYSQLTLHKQRRNYLKASSVAEKS